MLAAVAAQHHFVCACGCIANGNGFATPEAEATAAADALPSNPAVAWSGSSKGVIATANAPH
jgi:hypothetical protein